MDSPVSGKFAVSLLCDLTGAVHDWMESQLEKYWEKCDQLVKKQVAETISNIDRLARCHQYTFSTQPAELFQEMKSCVNYPQGNVHHCDRISRSILADIAEFEEQGYSVPGLDTFKTEVKQELSACRRKVRSINRANQDLGLDLSISYDEALKRLERYTQPHHGSEQLIRNLAFLSASSHFFATCCLHEQLWDRISRSVEGALQKLLWNGPSNKAANAILESYLVALIRRKSIARIRGNASAKSEVCAWYDPRGKVFYLPAETYFDHLSSAVQIPLTKRGFEMELVDEGVLHEDKNRRRTVQRVVIPDGERKSCIMVALADLSSSFRTNSEVQSALRRMEAEPTGYRAQRPKIFS